MFEMYEHIYKDGEYCPECVNTSGVCMKCGRFNAEGEYRGVFHESEKFKLDSNTTETDWSNKELESFLRVLKEATERERSDLVHELLVGIHNSPGGESVLKFMEDVISYSFRTMNATTDPS